MKLNELFSNEDIVLTENASVAWAKSGDKVVRKYRCGTGPRAGRLVNSPTDCSKKLDFAKRQQMKKLLARVGKRIARKAKRTKRVNPIYKQAQARNNAIRSK